ncbi:MAG: protein translocase subunit SecF [Proteobacteria bacterium]|nr:protein translocase subunit SecF [Pseudomonadota bacterium]
MKKDIDIVKYAKAISFVTLLSVLVALVIIAIVPFNQSIEFRGGSTIQIEMHANSSIEELSFVLPKHTKSSLTNSRFNLHFSNSINEDIKTKIEQYATIYSIFVVAPSITQNLIYKSLMAIVFSIIAIFVYIFLRFNIYYSLGTISTILHDVILVVAFIKVCHIEFNITIIAAILTIIGYSVNDTVIIYDKIRTLLTLKSNIHTTINHAITSTLARTIGTSLSTALAIIPVLFLTSGSIKDFCLIVIFGIAVGTVSSIAVSALVLLPFQKKLFEIIKLKNELKTT